MTSHVLVMAKEPVPGRVKTRLCPPCTPREAADLAEAALADTLDAVAHCGATRRIVALDGAPGPWLPTGFEVISQVQGSLDRRLAAAWDSAGGPGLQIGMDTPQVTTDLLDDCLATLDHRHSALGLAVDGGWWAIALRRSDERVFIDVPMSTEATGRAQLSRLRLLGLDVEILPTLVDLDRVTDIAEVVRSGSAPRTAATVDRLCLLSASTAAS